MVAGRTSQILAADRESIHRRVVSRWELTGREDPLGQHPIPGLRVGNRLRAEHGGVFEHDFERLGGCNTGSHAPNLTAVPTHSPTPPGGSPIHAVLDARQHDR